MILHISTEIISINVRLRMKPKMLSTVWTHWSKIVDICEKFS